MDAVVYMIVGLLLGFGLTLLGVAAAPRKLHVPSLTFNMPMPRVPERVELPLLPLEIAPAPDDSGDSGPVALEEEADVCEDRQAGGEVRSRLESVIGPQMGVATALARLRRSMKTAAIADAVGCAPRSVYRWERTGYVKRPVHLSALQSLARHALGADVTIVNGTPQKPGPRGKNKPARKGSQEDLSLLHSQTLACRVYEKRGWTRVKAQNLLAPIYESPDGQTRAQIRNGALRFMQKRGGDWFMIQTSPFTDSLREKFIAELRGEGA